MTVTAGMPERELRLSPRRRRIKKIFCNWQLYLFLLPTVAYFLIFRYYPMYGLQIAFRNYKAAKGIWGSQWVGLDNFTFFFKSTVAARVIWNTLYLNILFIITGTLMSLALAIMLNEIRSRSFVRVSQTFMLLPYYLSWVVIAYMLQAVFSNKNGLMNNILTLFGQKRISWYTRADLWPAILVIMRMWKGAGMNAIIFLAAITGIDESIYEAAMIDGATRGQRIRRITVPLIMPTVTIMTLLSIGKIMYGDFGMVYALIGDNGVLYETTDIIDTYVFRVLRQTGDPSQAMAIGLFQSVIGFLMVYGSNTLVKRKFGDGALF